MTWAEDIEAHRMSAVRAVHIAHLAREAVARSIARARSTGATEQQIARALDVSVQTVTNWADYSAPPLPPSCMSVIGRPPLSTNRLSP